MTSWLSSGSSSKPISGLSVEGLKDGSASNEAVKEENRYPSSLSRIYCVISGIRFF